jgi:putative restriction endonuclease
MFDAGVDAQVRTAAFNWLSSQVAAHGDVLPRSSLSEGFVFNGVRIPLIAPQGIFKPKVLREVPLTITTAPESPYDDAFGPDGLLRYRYRGSDPEHADNRGLRKAMTRRLPLAYFHGVLPGRYVATWPVYIVGDHPENLTFSVAVDDMAAFRPASSLELADRVSEDRTEVRRAYATAAVRVRLHQRAFRERVLRAYRQQCAFCRFRHPELLDAAHILPDSDPGGEPVVRNGLALCTLHHGAFDRLFLGVRPDYTIEVRPDILREEDGPTLAHAIQALHEARISIPRVASHRPDPALLEIRYHQFRDAFNGGSAR